MQSYNPFMNRFIRQALTLVVLVGLLLGTLPASTTFASTQTDLIGPAGSGQFGQSVRTLPNGNIVVSDTEYSEGENLRIGAVYLYNGRTGALISTLTGSTGNDGVGLGMMVLPNSSYVVSSPNWSNGAVNDVGAVTWCSGDDGLLGRGYAQQQRAGHNCQQGCLSDLRV